VEQDELGARLSAASTSGWEPACPARQATGAFGRPVTRWGHPAWLQGRSGATRTDKKPLPSVYFVEFADTSPDVSEPDCPT
jgi:hypothetical protein